MNEEQVPETGENPVEKGKRKRAKRAGKKTSKKKDAQDQILIEMGDKEAYANYERRKRAREQTKNNALKIMQKKDIKLNLETQIQEGDKEAYAKSERKKMAQEKTKMAQEKAKNDALKKKEMQLYLETRFQEVVTKHKMLIQNRPPVPHKPATSFVISSKKKQLKPQPNSQPNPTGPKPKLKPKPAHQMAVAKWESVAKIRTVFALMTAGQSLVQMPGPSTALITPEQCEQQSGSAGQAPARSLEQSGPASQAPGQSLEQSGPVGQPPGQSLQQMAPATTNSGQDVTVTPGQSGQQPETIPALKKRKRARRGGIKVRKYMDKKANKAQYSLVNVNNLSTPSSSQYQAPHQDEPEDLTDDLAPNMAENSGQQQQGSQLPITSDNKLNFKFQRSDWLEVPNFKPIGGEPPAELAEVKQSSNQTINTGSNTGQPRTASPAAGQSKQAKEIPPQKAIVIQKVEIIQKSRRQIKMMKKEENRLKQFIRQQDRPPNPNATIFQQDLNLYNFQTPVEYPKGIPKSFLVQDKLIQDAAQALNFLQPSSGVPQSFPVQEPQHYSYPMAIQPNNTVLGFPAGIPKSFILQEREKRMQEAAEYSAYPPEMNPEPDYPSQPSVYADLPSWILPTAPKPLQVEIYEGVARNVGPNEPTFAQPQPIPDRAYSPSDVYSEMAGRVEEGVRSGSESPELLQGQKRLSAFKRLGPLTKPNKPKLTINLTLNKEQPVREVLDETDDASYRFVPVHLRKDILQSTDDTVVKFLPFWPWKKNLVTRKTVSARFSKSVMILEQEQMESVYEKETLFIQVTVKGYPKTWNKEDVLDAVLECVKGKSFIPCFIEFTPKECKFLVIRCRAGLIAIHKVGFCIRKDNVELTVSISSTDTSLNQIDLIPRLVLRKRLINQYDGESALDLTEFLIEKDVSHFVYFPLNRVTNQLELMQLQSAVAWDFLTELNLSKNRLTTLDGFDLPTRTPRLKLLDLSYNRLDKLTALLRLRELPLRSLRLEGNPLCHDYIDASHYIRVAKMIFSGLKELDGVRIPVKGELRSTRRNYCPEAAAAIVGKFLEVFFPLLEAPLDERAAIEHLYDKDAVLTVTFRYKLRYGQAYRYFRNLFLRARSLEENDMESIQGAAAIATLVGKWPAILHDRYAITVDVLHHDDSTTIFRVGGVLKLTAETLAEDEHLLTFTRNIVLHTRNGAEYKIHHEMLYWDVPSEEVIKNCFNVTTVRHRPLSIKLESPPDDELKSKLVDIFVKLADIDLKRGERCLELKNWDLRSALEYYVALLKRDDLSVLSAPKERTTPAPQTS